MKNLLLTGFAAFATLAPIANAETPFYAEGGYTHLMVDEDEIDADLGALTARGGYDFTQNFAVEVEGMVGIDDDEFEYGPATAEVELNYLVAAYLRANLPITDKFSAFARLGVAQAELEAEASLAGFSLSESEDDSGAAYGAGVQYDFTNRFGIRGEYTRYDIGDLDVDSVAVTGVVNF